MVEPQNKSKLEWMLDHELRLAERYRRFLSVCMIRSAGSESLLDLLAVTLRQSDLYFEFEENVGVVLMSETDKSGALAAIERFRRQTEHNASAYFAVGSYPNDNMRASQFVTTVYNRLKGAEADELVGSTTNEDE
jgi:hypothetical protein